MAFGHGSGCVQPKQPNRLGAHSAQKLAYYTSGDVTGDSREVVGYGAVVVSR